MKHFLFLSFAFLLLSTEALFRPPVALAQNKAGINIGTKYSDLDQAISTVGSGGWIVVIAGGTGDCTTLQEAVDKTNAANVNLIIRGHLNNALSSNDAKAWVATLGQLKSNNRLYFMPWNEPNQEGSGDFASPQTVAIYGRALIQNLNDSGVNTKIFLLSPMMNISHPNFDSYVSSLGSGFFNLFDGIAFSLYDTCNGECSDLHQNPLYSPQLLSQIGASGKKIFGVESGTGGNFFYFKQSPSVSSPLYKYVNNFLSNSPSEIAMIGLPSYDLAGEVGHSWNLFNPPDTTNLLASQPKGNATPANFNQNAFEKWLQPLISGNELIPCVTCGYAYKDNRGLCYGTAFTPPGEEPGAPPPRSGTDSRPFACENCNTTDKLVGSCATSFTINDQIKYQKKEGAYCDLQDPGWWVEKGWGGTISLDPSSTTIPFVGKKGLESEQNYLADYFEGTDKYYYFYQGPVQRLSHAGVWRKLAPKKTQDDLKREMIGRSCGDEGIRDYQVISERGETALLSEIANYLPPLETEMDYLEKYVTWTNNDGGKWARLWAAVPMFSREDTPGQIVPYVGTKIKDQAVYLPPSQVEKVPHLARLYEATKAVSELLKPSKEESPQSTNNNTTLLAAADNYSPGEKVLLAQGQSGCFHLEAESSASSQGGSVTVYVTLKVYSDGGDGHIQLSGGTVSSMWRWNKGYVNPFVILPQYTGPVSIPYGGSTSKTWAVKIDECGDRGNYHDLTCNFSVDNAGNLSTNCGAAVPPPPSCGLPNASPVDSCNKEAIRDTNPNDTLCCSLMKINLSAVDQTKNTQHTPCEYGPCVFDEWGQRVCPTEPINDCNDWVPVDVDRQVGITLAHPYLSEIWDYTGKDKTGVFNIFRPETTEKFKELDAASDIQYSYSPGTVDPATGSFYFPYLGGIQRAKEWVVRTILPPNLRY